MNATSSLRLSALAAIVLAGVARPETSFARQTPSDDPGAGPVLVRLKKKDPGIEKILNDAVGYAVFPSVGKAAIGVGGAHGKGVVYEHGKKIGRSTLSQLTIGLQFGGQAYSEVVIFKDQEALDNFKKGNLKLDGQASAVAVKERVSADLAYRDGVAIVTISKGGLMYEAAVGGQKFSFEPEGAGN
ncbi:MAG TPA: lipid-binding SYLF domain-containing protein [Gemmatimonadales bacterium]|jgi:lipid-binding SYLF domain-containing protein|nr:lipid-binding SYLF domain-containing protein [Gemmatimonadales bacterium]